MDEVKVKGKASGIREDELEAGHRRGCNKEPDFFVGTHSVEGVCHKVFGCACGATERRVDATTGEILKEEVS